MRMTSVRRWSRRTVAVVVCLAAAVAGAGCNTVSGLGQDIQSLGEGTTSVAEGGRETINKTFK